jgi:hypothetical protein
MRKHIAIALFVLALLCSVVSMKPEPKTTLVAGSAPTPCWPPASFCPPQK